MKIESEGGKREREKEKVDIDGDGPPLPVWLGCVPEYAARKPVG